MYVSMHRCLRAKGRVSQGRRGSAPREGAFGGRVAVQNANASIVGLEVVLNRRWGVAP